MSGWPSDRDHNHRGGGRGRGGAGRGRGRGRGGGSHHPGSRGRGTFAQHHQHRDSGYGSRQHRNHANVSTESNPHGTLCCDHVDENPPSSSADPTTAPLRCQFRTCSALALTLHKADRHLIYPEGGIEELKRLDPMLVAEQREQQRRMRQNQRRNPHPLPSRPNGPSVKGDGDDGKDSEDNDEDAGDDDSDDGTDSSSSLQDEVDEPKLSAAQAQESGRVLDGPADATISGLNIQLDSPELIAEWISQRKKRWPTQNVVEQKLKEKEERQKRSEAIYGPRPMPFGKRPREEAAAAPAPVAPNQDKAQRSDPDEKRQKTNNEAAALADADGDDKDSDDDAPPEEVSSKALVESMEEDQSAVAPQAHASDAHDRRPVCTHFLQGRCNYGDRCKKRHESKTGAFAPTSHQHSAKLARRPHPRPPPVNPFDQPDLLRQLLRNEIEKHVDAVGQAIRFIVDNDMLLHVETEEGQAEEQRKQREKIQVLPSQGDVAAQPEESALEEEAAQPEASASSALTEEVSLSEPLIHGGMAVIKSASAGTAQSRASLYRPSSPTLRSLSDLKYPPEPDPLIFLDPLRRDDPKPLLPSQLVRIAKDPVIRSIVTPSTPLHPNGHKPPSLERAIVSLDALPTDLYRNAAIEMILGVASSTSTNPHAGAGLIVTSKDGRRKVSETDLFRMGLRVGGDQVLAIKKLADRLSVLLGSSLQLDEVGEADWALLSAEQRNEMRKLHYDREADRLDRLRKLGIDV